ncbi:MAG: hypothetical protein AB1733_22300, partial [Thermodesulfobacteriota bacterium]
SSMVGQFGEHFARWLRWVNFVSTQAGGSVFRSTGGSIFESVKVLPNPLSHDGTDCLIPPTSRLPAERPNDLNGH